jgi:peptidoglycan hydrolase FlgJ
MAQPSTQHTPHLRAAASRHVPPHVQAFIDTHLEAAKSIQTRYHVPVGVVLAQSALETRWGQAVVGNAYFGVKGRAPSGASTTFTTHEVVNGQAIQIDDAFRAYGSYEDAAADYANMLRTNSLYRSCFLYTNSAKFAAALARSGYATDPAYFAKLNSIIRTYKLEQYDEGRSH